MKRVPVAQAAKELGMSQLSVRVLMESGQLPIGDCGRRKGCKRSFFFIYRKLLDEEKQRRGL